MQLYTVGLHELHPDGTEVRDVHGQVERTYTNLDILSKRPGSSPGSPSRPRRGNVEELFRSHKSRQDPLRIEVDRHDLSPKTSLGGGWLGDRYPLCADLPNRPFLSAGAKYRFNGGSR